MYHPRHARWLNLSVAVRLLIAALAVLALILLVAGTRTISVEQTPLISSSLPAEIRQLRIVFVSDIHERGFPFFSHAQTVGLVTKINALNPDIVLLGGDYAESPADTMDFFQHLPSIKANYGVYAVLGEHDRDANTDMTKLRHAMAAAGVTPLINELGAVRVGNSLLYIAGLDDQTNGTPQPAALAAQVRSSDFVVLLAHNPLCVTAAQQAVDAAGRKGWFDLGLFGHTHGGQMGILPSVPWVQDVPARYLRGWIEENRVPLLISSGVGTVGLPLRLFCPPQIHVITVRNR